MKNIIWISSYPKSGNTFLRILLSTYFYSKDGIYNQDLLNKIQEFPRDFFEFKQQNNLIDEINLWEAKQKKINLETNNYIFLKTHSANCLINKKFKTIFDEFTMCSIYIYRDPRNVFLSLKDHKGLSEDRTIEYLFDNNNCLFIKSKNGSRGYTPILDWQNNFLSWKKNENKIETFFVKYEDLVSKTEDVLKKILFFLNKYINQNIDEKKISKVLNSTSFEKLQKIEKNEGFIENKIMGLNKNPNLFFNKGKKRNFNNELSRNLIIKIQEKYSKVMHELGYL